MSRLYGPTDASKAVASATGRKVGVSTIRAWATTYAPFLSDGATPPAGGRREFTERDVAIFGEIARLRRQGVSESVILDRMPEIAAGLDTRPAAATTQAPDDTDGPLQVPVPAGELGEVLTALQASIESDRVKTERVDHLEGRINRLESWIMVGAGVIVVLLLIMVLLLIFR